MMNRIWNEESGVLTFEWILLLTLLVIGIVGGLAAVRDAYIIELTSAANAITTLDEGYNIIGPVEIGFTASPTTAATLPALTVAATTTTTAAGTLSLDRNTTYTLAAGTWDNAANAKKTGATGAGTPPVGGF